MPPISLERAFHWVKWTRDTAGLDKLDPPYNWERIRERCFPDVTVTGTRLPRKQRAMVTVDGRGKIRIFYKRLLDTNAQTFNIIHEFYHVLTDASDPANRLPDRGGCQSDPLHELEADFYAMHVLIPVRLLDPLVSRELLQAGDVRGHLLSDEVDKWCRIFGVPRRYMLTQLRDYKSLLDSSAYLRGLRPRFDDRSEPTRSAAPESRPLVLTPVLVPTRRVTALAPTRIAPLPDILAEPRQPLEARRAARGRR